MERHEEKSAHKFSFGAFLWVGNGTIWSFGERFELGRRAISYQLDRLRRETRESSRRTKALRAGETEKDGDGIGSIRGLTLSRAAFDSLSSHENEIAGTISLY